MSKIISEIKKEPFGFVMFLLGQFTLWPQAFWVISIHSALGLSWITCSVGLIMSICSCVYAYNKKDMFWFKWDSISNLLAGSLILFLKFYL